MKKEIKKIFEVFDSHKKNLANKTIPLGKGEIDQVLSGIYSPGASFQSVFDHAEQAFIYVSDSVSEMLEEDPVTFTAERFFMRIHPDDLVHFKHCQDVAGYFYFTFIEKKDIPFYKVSYQYRYKMKSGKYKLILHQAISITTDQGGNMANVLTNVSNISHITNVNNGKMSFMDIRNGKSFSNISRIEDLSDKDDHNNVISNREIEILRLLSEGFSSKDIASYLNISYDTVRTHRNNILKKTKFANLTQAVSHYIKEGLI